MKKFILLKVTLLISTSLLSAQSASDRARAYYFQAEGMYEAGDYKKTLEYLKEAEDLLGESNARIELLAVKALFADKQYNEAKSRISRFYTVESTDAMKREMSGYIVQVEDKLKEIEEEKERQRLARIEAEREAAEARERARRQAEIEKERQRIANERRNALRARRLMLTNKYLSGVWKSVDAPANSRGTQITFVPTGDYTGYYYAERKTNDLSLEQYADLGGTDQMDYSGAYSRMAEMEGRIFIKYSEGVTEGITIKDRTNPISKKQNKEYLLNKSTTDGSIYLGAYELVYDEDQILMKEEVLLDLEIFKGWQYDLDPTNNVDADGFRRYDIKADGPIYALREGGTLDHQHPVDYGLLEKHRDGANPAKVLTNLYSLQKTSNETIGLTQFGFSIEQLADLLEVQSDLFPTDRIWAFPMQDGRNNTGFTVLSDDLDTFVNLKANELYEAGDPEEAFELLQVNAGYGNVRSQYLLGLLYVLGEGVAEDEQQAINWFKQSADQGYAPSQCQLGMANLYGYGMPVDQHTAVRWMEGAVRDEDSVCNYHYGKMLLHGWGTDADTTRAKDLLTRAAEEGKAEAAFLLGTTWERQNRLGIARNWYRKADELRQEGMQEFISAVSLKIRDFEESKSKGFRLRLPKIRMPRFIRGGGDAEPDTTSSEWQRKNEQDKSADRARVMIRQKEYTRALNLLIGNAAGGHAESQMLLGKMNLNGQGLPQSNGEAFKLFKKAAEKNNAEAQFWLGDMHFKGTAPEFSSAKGLSWYEKAGNNGNMRAQFKLGSLYYKGEVVTINHVKAFKWFEKAAQQGHLEAAYYTGRMLYLGEGVLIDESEARDWLELVAAEGEFRLSAFYLAEMFELGRGGAEDLSEAISWYEELFTFAERDEFNSKAALRLFELYRKENTPAYERMFTDRELLDLVKEHGDSYSKEVAEGHLSRL